MMAALQAFAAAFFSELFGAVNVYVSNLRADKAQVDLGRTQAQLEQAKATNDVLQEELEEAVKGPPSAQDAIERLRKGEA